MRIAMTRAEKKLRWEQPAVKLATQAERMKETAKSFKVVPKKQNILHRMINVFRSQRGN